MNSFLLLLFFSLLFIYKVRINEFNFLGHLDTKVLNIIFIKNEENTKKNFDINKNKHHYVTLIEAKNNYNTKKYKFCLLPENKTELFS